MASTKSPYKEMRISISKVLGWDKTTRKDPKKQKSKIMEVIESGKSPGVVGYKNGGKW